MYNKKTSYDDVIASTAFDLIKKITIKHHKIIDRAEALREAGK